VGEPRFVEIADEERALVDEPVDVSEVVGGVQNLGDLDGFKDRTPFGRACAAAARTQNSSG
jgi:hypothetical protein